MLINWFTVGAQVLNFLILVWLMKRFLYQPILNAIDAREKRIAAELADAAKQQAGARRERDEFRHKNREFEQQRADRMERVVADATAERRRLFEEARQAADAQSAQRQQALQREQHSLNATLIRHTREEVFAIARKALTELAGISLEQRMAEVLVQRLQALGPQERAQLGQALASVSVPVRVCSAFTLPQAQQREIQAALSEVFSADIQPTFETDPQLVSGIELCADGCKVAWSIDEYLTAMKQHIDQRVAEPDSARTDADPAVSLQSESRE
ncbi:F0F1 ATP synthase subunit delta [uncultured Oceanisphaera sp.]|uniref:F0F1 ATP synthase subunit delta n=1 Tax=uncultured Oceanisphaera sp. TaxID=353858 RepID=UPI002636D81D|nr:F0F1 ATP synthase subunit delta [uncultured Oceanisphaera sp.]